MYVISLILILNYIFCLKLTGAYVTFCSVQAEAALFDANQLPTNVKDLQDKAEDIKVAIDELTMEAEGLLIILHHLCVFFGS